MFILIKVYLIRIYQDSLIFFKEFVIDILLNAHQDSTHAEIWF